MPRFNKFLRSGARHTHSSRSRRHGRALRFEGLEQRSLLAASVFLNEYGVVRIAVDDGRPAEVRSLADVTVTIGDTPANRQQFTFAADRVKEILFSGSGLNDLFTNRTAFPSTAHGYAGNDELTGGRGVDHLYGGGGNDTLTGGLGDDTLSGGEDDDKLFGEGGNDHLNGGEGNDILHGGTGRDILVGEDGQDRLFGDQGNDDLWGKAGNDSLYGGIGYDRLFGGLDSDVIVGLDVALDYVDGGGGADILWIDARDSVVNAAADDTVERVSEFRNGADRSLNGDNLTDPAMAGDDETWATYVNMSDHPLFAATGPSERDIDQGALGDCWLMSGIGSIARANPDHIRQVVVDLGDETYGVKLGNFFYRVDADLPCRNNTTTLIYAGVGQDDSIWAPIFEKAYAYHQGLDKLGAADYGPLNGDSESRVYRDLKLSDLVNKRVTDTGSLYVMAGQLSWGKALVVSIITPATGAPLIGNHVYMVIGINFVTRTDGIDYWAEPVSVTLRNPWGVDGAGHDGQNDGLVTVAAADFIASHVYFAAARA